LVSKKFAKASRGIRSGLLRGWKGSGSKRLCLKILQSFNEFKEGDCLTRTFHCGGEEDRERERGKLLDTNYEFKGRGRREKRWTGPLESAGQTREDYVTRISGIQRTTLFHSNESDPKFTSKPTNLKFRGSQIVQDLFQMSFSKFVYRFGLQENYFPNDKVRIVEMWKHHFFVDDLVILLPGKWHAPFNSCKFEIRVKQALSSRIFFLFSMQSVIGARGENTKGRRLLDTN
jgi:hypothetical protein